MPKTITVDLRLVAIESGYELHYKEEDGTYSKVTNTKPNKGINGGDTIQWTNSDGSIAAIKIKFLKNNIVKNKDIVDNQTSHPSVTCALATQMPGGGGKKLYDSYEIKVKPSGGGGYKDYDPPITYPQT